MYTCPRYSGYTTVLYHCKVYLINECIVYLIPIQWSHYSTAPLYHCIPVHDTVVANPRQCHQEWRSGDVETIEGTGVVIHLGGGGGGLGWRKN